MQKTDAKSGAKRPVDNNGKTKKQKEVRPRGNVEAKAKRQLDKRKENGGPSALAAGLRIR